jgi:hypothetical protein
VKILTTTMLVASMAFATPIAIEAANAQTNYSASKPHVTKRPNEVRAGSKVIYASTHDFGQRF